MSVNDDLTQSRLMRQRRGIRLVARELVCDRLVRSEVGFGPSDAPSRSLEQAPTFGIEACRARPQYGPGRLTSVGRTSYLNLKKTLLGEQAERRHPLCVG